MGPAQFDTGIRVITLAKMTVANSVFGNFGATEGFRCIEHTYADILNRSAREINHLDLIKTVDWVVTGDAGYNYKTD